MAGESDAAELGVHRTGYDRFVGLMKYGTIASFVIAMIVVLIIAN